jgi:hypothetical protein
MHLPANIDDYITERSRKFYDGTYKWDSEGFTDETGSKCAVQTGRQPVAAYSSQSIVNSNAMNLSRALPRPFRLCF